MTEAQEVATLQRLHARLAALSPADWQTIARQLDPLRGEAIGALWRRAGHRSLWSRAFLPQVAPGVHHTLSALGELVAEFRPRGRVAADVERARARRQPTARHAVRDAMLDLLALADARLPDDRLAVDAVTMAGVLASRPDVDPALLATAWAPLEPVVPLASVRGAVHEG